jgi:hypothetical protein
MKSPPLKDTTPTSQGSNAALGVFGERKNLVKHHGAPEPSKRVIRESLPVKTRHFNVFNQSELNSLLHI